MPHPSILSLHFCKPTLFHVLTYLFTKILTLIICFSLNAVKKSVIDTHCEIKEEEDVPILERSITDKVRFHIILHSIPIQLTCLCLRVFVIPTLGHYLGFYQTSDLSSYLSTLQ